MKIRIIVPLTLSEPQRSRLSALGADYFAVDRIDPKQLDYELAQRVGDAEIVVVGTLVPMSGQFLRSHPKIKMIQSMSTGLDNVDLKTAAALGVVVQSAGDYCTEAVAERTLTMMLNAATQFVAAHNTVVAGQWDPFKIQGKELRGRCLFIVGRGLIGTRVGELATAFGMKIVWANSKTTKEEFHHSLGLADFVSLHCPYGTETHHLLNGDAFRALKPGAVVINTARGKLIDETALQAAIDGKRVSFAALDVLETQPPAKDNPLLHHDRVLVTPFCAWHTEEAVHSRSEIIIQNINRFISEGRQLKAPAK